MCKKESCSKCNGKKVIHQKLGKQCVYFVPCEDCKDKTEIDFQSLIDCVNKKIEQCSLAKGN